MIPIVQTLLNQLRVRNPNGFNYINSLMQNGGNTDSIMTQMFANISPNQKQNILNQAKNYGCPEDILNHFKNMK